MDIRSIAVRIVARLVAPLEKKVAGDNSIGAEMRKAWHRLGPSDQQKIVNEWTSLAEFEVHDSLKGTRDLVEQYKAIALFVGSQPETVAGQEVSHALALLVGALRSDVATYRMLLTELAMHVSKHVPGLAKAQPFVCDTREKMLEVASLVDLYIAKLKAPIPLILNCPSCGERHVDEGEWLAKPHKTHCCQSCGFVWRPAVEATVGVQFLPGFKNKEG